MFEQLSSTIDWQVLELQSGRKIAQKHVLNAWSQIMKILYTGAKGVMQLKQGFKGVLGIGFGSLES